MRRYISISALVCLSYFSIPVRAQDCGYPPCVPTGQPPVAEGQFDYAWDTNTCSWELQPCTQCNSPIIIDTDGSGFHLTSAAGGVLFDFYGTGNPIQVSWTAQGSTNGWLALDRNHNGVIDSARELFGNITAQPKSAHMNGFLALAEFDKPENGGNGDGIIDSSDEIWPELLVWIDANHDGISQPQELIHLNDVGIRSISLKYRDTPLEDQYGNDFRYKGHLDPVARDNVDRVIYDVFLTHVNKESPASLGSNALLHGPSQGGPTLKWTLPGTATRPSAGTADERPSLQPSRAPSGQDGGGQEGRKPALAYRECHSADCSAR